MGKVNDFKSVGVSKMRVNCRCARESGVNALMSFPNLKLGG
jgi:hypothetical protein